MFELFQSLRWVHIACGSVALVLFWIPAFAKKGGQLHVRVGWVYAACMGVVVLTAFSLSGMAYGWPLAIRHFAKPLPVQDAAAFIRYSHRLAFFLAYLAGVTLAAGWQGIGVTRTRRAPEAFRNVFTYGLNVAVVLAAVGSLVMGVRHHNTVFMGMSSVGFLVSGGNLVYLLRRSEERMGWWYQHLTAMIATGIAGYTAFLVFGGTHLLEPLARRRFYPLLWFLPTLIGVPAIALCNAYYRRKFSGRTGTGGALKTEMKAAY